MIDPTLSAYVSATLLFAATPGQTTTVVIQQTVDAGWRAGIAAAVGAAVANVGHAAVAGLGLAMVASRMPEALTLIRIGGTGYLAWLGGQSLWRAAWPPPSGPPPAQAGRVAFGEGLVTNLLNPSILTFYLVVVPTFMPATDRLESYLLRAAIHVSLAFACHNAWAALFHQIGHWLRSVRARRLFDALAGLALWWLGARVAFRV